jgi:hypothetical protein
MLSSFFRRDDDVATVKPNETQSESVRERVRSSGQQQQKRVAPGIRRNARRSPFLAKIYMYKGRAKGGCAMRKRCNPTCWRAATQDHSEASEGTAQNKSWKVKGRQQQQAQADSVHRTDENGPKVQSRK